MKRKHYQQYSLGDTFPFSSSAVAHVNSVWGSELVFKRMCQCNKTGIFLFFFAKRQKKKHPPLLFIVLHSQRKSRGRVNAVILFRGQRGATHNVPQGHALGSFPFLSTSPLIPTSERNICVCSAAALALLKMTLECKNTPQMHTQTQTTRPPIIASPKQIPSWTQRPVLTFAVTEIKPESGHNVSGKGRAFHVISDWPVLGKRSANNRCHWAVMDEVAGAGHRPRSQARRPFFSQRHGYHHGNTFRHLSWSCSRPGKGKQEVIHGAAASRADLDNSLSWPVTRNRSLKTVRMQWGQAVCLCWKSKVGIFSFIQLHLKGQFLKIKKD